MCLYLCPEDNLWALGIWSILGLDESCCLSNPRRAQKLAICATGEEGLLRLESSFCGVDKWRPSPAAGQQQLVTCSFLTRGMLMGVEEIVVTQAAADSYSQHTHVPVSGGVKVVPGGGAGQLSRAAPGSQSSRRFRPPASGRGGHAVSRLPLLPPIPRFTFLEQLQAFRQDWPARAVSQQLPHITASGLKNGPLKQRRLTKYASLYLTRSESNPQRWGPFLVRTCSLQSLICTVLTVCVGKASRGSRHPRLPSGSKTSRLEQGARYGMAALDKR